MSVVKQRNKRQKSNFLKTYWRIYKEFDTMRKQMGYTLPMGGFAKRLVKVQTKQEMKGKM